LFRGRGRRHDRPSRRLGARGEAPPDRSRADDARAHAPRQGAGPDPHAFAPNAGLAITPAYLDAVLGATRAAGYRIVPLAEVKSRLVARAAERFVALTFDDGYRDNLDHALPVLERHAAPATIFVTTGFADRTTRLWWLDLEALIRRSDRLEGSLDGRSLRLATATTAEKRAAFTRLATTLIGQPAAQASAILVAFGSPPSEGSARVGQLCLDWPALVALAAHPLVTIGCHTLTHAPLAALAPEDLRRELEGAKAVLEDRLGRAVTHLAYPYGSPRAAGPREFAAAAAAGFDTGVTTRPGVLLAQALSRATAFPRLSVNGRWQTPEAFAVLLSGVPFLPWRLLQQSR
jgi:peptidoglycan/xylan/chitin deacetylase (PgdA/CDA1 family)